MSIREEMAGVIGRAIKIDRVVRPYGRPHDNSIELAHVDQLLAITQDSPITRERDCPECGGTGKVPFERCDKCNVTVTREEYYNHPIGMEHADEGYYCGNPAIITEYKTCPHCDNGKVREELVADKWENCEKMARCKQRLSSPRFRKCQEDCQWHKYIPITPANAGEFERFEWRKA